MVTMDSDSDDTIAIDAAQYTESRFATVPLIVVVTVDSLSVTYRYAPCTEYTRALLDILVDSPDTSDVYDILLDSCWTVSFHQQLTVPTGHKVHVVFTHRIPESPDRPDEYLASSDDVV